MISAVDALERPTQAPLDPEQAVYKKAEQLLATLIERRS